MQRGKLIVIEGTDGSGKNTQKELLVEKFKKDNYPVQGISFPKYGTPTGDIVGDIYLGKTNRIPNGKWFGNPDKLNPQVASLYYAADRLAHKDDMTKLLREGVNIISDRYIESNMGHQGGKIIDIEKRKNMINWIERLEYNFLEMPKPNAVIFLYLPYQLALDAIYRRGNDIDGHETEEHLKNAEECYLEICERYGWKKVLCAHNSTMRTREKIHEDIWNFVKDIL